jgi:glycosyltransferase involved in cell wall biosynthesis
MAIIEAMTMGRPVVATRAGGNLELVRDGETGILVERSHQALARAIVEILGDAGRRTRMGRDAEERARALFSAQAMAQGIETVYHAVVGQG